MDAATARFLWRFSHPSQDPSNEREVMFSVGAESRHATVYLPPSRLRGPAWVLLHGVTVPGRHHEGLRRMARSLAAAGHFVFVPEVPAWSDLRLDVGETERTLAASVAALETVSDVDSSRLGLMAFSVAATWSLVAAAGPLAGRFRVVAAMGAYADVRSMLRGMIGGERSLHGRRVTYSPDPYGRWILGANLLPLLPSEEWGRPEQRRLAALRLRTLAVTAGRNGALAREPVYDALIVALRDRIEGRALAAWDVLAPRSDARPQASDDAFALADALAEAARAACPELEPAGRLGGLNVPVILLHGFSDALIPYTESLKLAGQLPPGVLQSVTITRLIGHTRSREARRPRSPVALARESAQLAGVFRRIVTALDDASWPARHAQSREPSNPPGPSRG